MEKAKGKKEHGNSKNLKKLIMAYCGGFFLGGGSGNGWQEEWRDKAREVSRGQIM